MTSKNNDAEKKALDASEETFIETNEEVKANVDDLALYSDTYPFNLPFRTDGFEDEKSMMRFVKNCERLIRASTEYRAWRDYIVNVLHHDTCVITQENIREVTIDVHHHIPSLYGLVETLINFRLDRNEEFSTFEIALEAIKLHYQNRVGYVTLLSSMHEKFHNGFLTIPMEFVKGDFRFFLREYGDYMSPNLRDSIDAKLSVTRHNCRWSKDNYPLAAEA